MLIAGRFEAVPSLSGAVAFAGCGPALDWNRLPPGEAGKKLHFDSPERSPGRYGVSVAVTGLLVARESPSMNSPAPPTR